MTDNAIQRLATYRLEQDLSFEELAQEMAAAGYEVRARSLHLLLTARLRTQPQERTRYKIQQFLAHVNLTRKTTKTKRGRRAGRTAA